MPTADAPMAELASVGRAPAPGHPSGTLGELANQGAQLLEVVERKKRGSRRVRIVMRHRLTVSMLAVAAGALALSACGGTSTESSQHRVTSTSGSTSTIAATTVPRPGSTAPISSSTSTTAPRIPPGTPPACNAAQLTLSVHGIQGGAGHAAAVLLFRDRGTPCSLRGYPSVDGLAANGLVVVRARQTAAGYLGGIRSGSAPPTVALKTGQTASALLEGLTGPTAGGAACPSYAALLVTPPHQTHSVRLQVSYTLCYPQVHPVLPGTTGGAFAP